MADERAFLLDLKAWRELWREDWRSVYGAVEESDEMLELLARIRSDTSIRAIEAYERDGADWRSDPRHKDFEEAVEARQRFLDLGGAVRAAREMEIAGNVHPAPEEGGYKWTWNVSYTEERLEHAGVILKRWASDELAKQDWATLDARLLLSHDWHSYEHWERYVESYVDSRTRGAPAPEKPPQVKPERLVARTPRPVVYFNAHDRPEKDLSREAWALRRALPALAELSDVLQTQPPIPRGLLPVTLHRLALPLPVPMNALAELIRQRHVVVAGAWLEPRGHAAWQELI
jgi:hypothetical protein